MINRKSTRQLRSYLASGAVAPLFFALCFLCGCSNTNTNPSQQGILVTTTPLSSTTIGTGETLVVMGNAGPGGVTWTLAGTGCTGAACGTLSNVAAGSVSYTAPSTISGSSLTATLTATSVSTPTASATLTLTVVPTTVSITSPASSGVAPGTSVVLTASVAGDVNNEGVTWSVSGASCSGTTCGTLTNITTTSATYTAPQTSGQNITVTATSIAIPAASAQLSFVVLTLSTTIKFSPAVLPAAIAGQSYSQTITVSGGVSPYKFTQANLPAWVKVTSTANSVTFAGTPATTDAGTFDVQLTVTDSTSPTALASLAYYALTTYANAATGNALLSGSYAFYGSGWQDGATLAKTERIGYIGSFNTDGNGNITAGELDVSNTAGMVSYTSLAGTYNIQSNQTGIVTLIPTVAGSATQNVLPITLAVSLGGIQGTANVATNGYFAEYDDSTGIGTTLTPNSSGIRISGPIAQQSSAALNAATSPLSGSYAFGMEGGNPYADVSVACATEGCPVSLAGAMTLSTAGVISTGEEDVTVGSTTTNAVPLSGALNGVGQTDASGRLPAILNAVSSSLLAWPSHYVIYVVNPQTFYFMSSDPYGTATLLSGQAMQQNLADIATTPFSSTQPFVMFGNVYGSTGLSTPNGDVRAVLQLFNVVPTSATAGSMSGTQFVNASGSFSNNAAIASATYTVGANGRVAPAASGTPALYLVDTNTGFGAANGTAAGTFQFFPQTGTSLNAGNYAWAILQPESAIGPTQVGVLTVPTGGVAATATAVALTGQAYASFPAVAEDQSNSAGSLLFNEPLTGTISNTNGVLTGITLSPGIQACGSGGGYVVSATEFACVSGTSTKYSEILIFHQ